MYNPYRRRRRSRRRNPVNPIAVTSTVKEWTQGVDAVDAFAAVAGLAAATMIPGMIVKDATTSTQKLMKLGISFIAAVAAGALGRSAVSPSAGKAAVIGGIAGTTTQALSMYTTIKVGSRTGIRESSLISPPSNREGEVVSMIQP